VHVVEIVEMKSYDVLEKASAARYQMLPKKTKLRYQKDWKNLLMNENQCERQ
jgi:hypothetical protein